MPQVAGCGSYGNTIGSEPQCCDSLPLKKGIIKPVSYKEVVQQQLFDARSKVRQCERILELLEKNSEFEELVTLTVGFIRGLR